MSGKERKCDICGKSFYSKKQLEQHSKDTHSTADKTKPVKKPFKITNKFITLIGVGVLVAIIAGVGIYYDLIHTQITYKSKVLLLLHGKNLC